MSCLSLGILLLLVLLLLPPLIRRMLCDHSLSFFYLFCHSVNRITDERGNGRRPNLAGTGKRWLSRSGWLLVVIRICAWIAVFYFLRHWGINHFPTFVSTSLFSQFSCNQQPTWTKLGEMNDADECIDNFGTYILGTSGSKLIRKTEFKSRSFSFQILVSVEVCTLYYRQNIFN